MKSIKQIEDIFKLFILRDNFFYALIVIIVAITSFGLGRLSLQPDMVSINKQSAGITLLRDAFLEDDRLTIPKELSDHNTVVGSKNGTRYYKEGCSGLTRIQEENRLYFISQDHARSAGYTPAVNCF